jgi:LacI family transcriptional regulator
MSFTIKDVARLAGVSVGTASMAVNGKAGVNDGTRASVLAAAASLDYIPNQNARNLINRKTSTLGLIVTDITNPFFAGIIDAVRREAEISGFKLLIGVSDDRIDEERRYVAEFIERGVEGLILVPVTDKEPDLSHLHRLQKLNIPFVFLTTAYREIAANCLMTDLAAGAPVRCHADSVVRVHTR